MIIFGTGHRPEDCDYSFDQMVDLSKDYLDGARATVVVTGMAAGFDLAWGLAAMDVGIDVWTVRPWATHKPRVRDRHIYDALEEYAVRHIVTNDSTSYPHAGVYDVRNRWMVDNSNKGVAFWNGKVNGGTFNCLKYAKSIKMEVTNIYPGGPVIE